MRTLASMLAAGSVSLGMCVPATAAAPPLPDGLYTITGSSDYFQGCVPPCLCAVVYLDDLKGSISLRYTHSDEFYDYYNVGSAVLNMPTLHWRYSGSGTFNIGGDFALLQSLSLDLTLQGQPPQLFRGVGSSAPAETISVSIMMNDLNCYDTVFNIEARPCRADANRSGEVDPTDVGFFVQTWISSVQLGNLEGDYDRNGQTTPADVGAFLSAWLAALEGNCPG